MNLKFERLTTTATVVKMEKLNCLLEVLKESATNAVNGDTKQETAGLEETTTITTTTMATRTKTRITTEMEAEMEIKSSKENVTTVTK